MILKIATAPATEPVSVEEAKTHLRVTTTADDTYIGTVIKTARQQVEVILQRALVTQTWDMALDCFPARSILSIPLPPLQSVTSISYVTKAGDTVVFDAANYVVDTYSEPGRIALVDTATWPSDELTPLSGVRIRFVAGYGLAAAVPEWARQAILLLVGDLYENREDTIVGTGLAATPAYNGMLALLWPHRMVRV